MSRVAVVDDHQTTIRGIAAVIDECDDLELVASASSVTNLLGGAIGEIDLLILDLRLPDLSGPQENCQRLRARGIENILVFTSFDDAYLVREAARAGVLGVVSKAIPDADLRELLPKCARGEHVITTEWAAAIDSDPLISEVGLSPQQVKVLRLIASGETLASAAKATGIQPDTVRDYIKRIQSKYSQAGRPTKTRADLYERAIEDGWLPVPRQKRFGCLTRTDV